MLSTTNPCTQRPAKCSTYHPVLKWSHDETKIINTSATIIFVLAVYVLLTQAVSVWNLSLHLVLELILQAMLSHCLVVPMSRCPNVLLFFLLSCCPAVRLSRSPAIPFSTVPKSLSSLRLSHCLLVTLSNYPTIFIWMDGRPTRVGRTTSQGGSDDQPGWVGRLSCGWVKARRKY